jgi:hypothetical protein
MKIFRLTILLSLLVLSLTIPLQSSAHEQRSGYIQYVNNLHKMIEVKYQNETKVDKLSALKKIILDIRKSSSVKANAGLVQTLASMECSIMLEVIDMANWRTKVQATFNYWVTPCDLNAPRYTFDSPESNVSITQISLPR